MTLVLSVAVGVGLFVCFFVDGTPIPQHSLSILGSRLGFRGGRVCKAGVPELEERPVGVSGEKDFNFS